MQWSKSTCHTRELRRQRGLGEVGNDPKLRTRKIYLGQEASYSDGTCIVEVSIAWAIDPPREPSIFDFCSSG